MEFAIAEVIEGLDVKEEGDFDIIYAACLSRSLFIIWRKCSRGTFESGLLQCSFQLILCRSFQIFKSCLIKVLSYSIFAVYRRSTFKTSNTIKRVCIFHLILVGIPSFLILPIKNRGEGVGFFLLNRQNPLRMTKVICRQSLTVTWKSSPDYLMLMTLNSERTDNKEQGLILPKMMHQKCLINRKTRNWATASPVSLTWATRMGYSRKNPNRGSWGHGISKGSWKKNMWKFLGSI